MRSVVFAIVFLSLADAAPGQPSSSPVSSPSRNDFRRWDAAGTAAFFNAKPRDNNDAYQDEWYFQDRYGIAVGRYWTEHIKSELEYSISGEGSIYSQRFTPLPSGQGVYPYSVQQFHRLEQAALRIAWQFGHNSWVHPYVSGGIVGDRERQRTFTPEQSQYLTGRDAGRLLLVPHSSSPTTTVYRFGFTAAAGTKVYMSSRSFFTTGVTVTWSAPAATVGWLAGLGIDF
jgi:hypothetical protein